MSLSKMSSAIQQHVLSRMVDILQPKPSAQFDNLSSYTNQSVTILDRQPILTSEAFIGLVELVNTAADELDLASISDNILKNLNYSNFVEATQGLNKADKSELFLEYLSDTIKIDSGKERLLNLIALKLKTPTGTKLLNQGIARKLSDSKTQEFRSSASNRFEESLVKISSLIDNAEYLNSLNNLVIESSTNKDLYQESGAIGFKAEIGLQKSSKKSVEALNSAKAQLDKLINIVNKQSIEEVGSTKLSLKTLLSELRKLNKFVKERSDQFQKLDRRKLDEGTLAKLNNIFVESELVEKLLDMEGSPSIKKHVGEVIAAAMSAKKIKSISSAAKVNKILKPARITSKPKPKTSGKNKPIAVYKPKEIRSSETSLQNLLKYIQDNLEDRVKANMGNGSRRDILNYRTGRFAASAAALRLTLSRNRLISVFYTYMKYPYATFSSGGQQQYPRSRDPKLLISKSIRQLAAQKVTNDVRGVLA
jgi:hypothetical protein